MVVSFSPNNDERGGKRLEFKIEIFETSIPALRCVRVSSYFDVFVGVFYHHIKFDLISGEAL